MRFRSIKKGIIRKTGVNFPRCAGYFAGFPGLIRFCGCLDAGGCQIGSAFALLPKGTLQLALVVPCRRSSSTVPLVTFRKSSVVQQIAQTDMIAAVVDFATDHLTDENLKPVKVVLIAQPRL